MRELSVNYACAKMARDLRSCIKLSTYAKTNYQMLGHLGIVLDCFDKNLETQTSLQEAGLH